MDRIKVGVIGYGYWGPNLTRNLYELPKSDLVAIADVSENRLNQAQSRYPNLIYEKDYHDFFRLNIQAVVIATPPATHYQIAKECLEHDLNVLVEKPLTLRSEDAEELIQLAEENKLTLMVGHTFEYNSAVHALKKYIDSGFLGQIYYLDAARLNLGLFQRDTNVLWDLAPHDISILLYLLGKRPLTVAAQGSTCIFTGVHDVVYMNLMFPENISAHVHVSWLEPCKVRRITVVGSKKMVVYNDIENETKIKIYDKGVDTTPEDTTGFGEFHCNYRTGDITIPNIHFVEPLRQECQHFLECIINHTEPCSCGREGLEVVKILEAAQLSLRDGQVPEKIPW
jgi:predicted dehydrogenase